MTSSEHAALPRSAPEAQGIASSAILALIDDAARDGQELHSLMVLRHGVVVAEGWWEPYAAQSPHMLFSLSKSFASTAAGLAIAEGKLSLDDSIVSFFPDDLPSEIGPNLAAMRLRHLLSMSTGHEKDTTGSLRGGENWVRSFLSQPVEHAPGTHFVYNSGATYMVSAIVQKVAGETVLEYLGPRLFEPLKIENPTWDVSPQGINVGGWGLNITTEDIAKFGQLYLQKGVWQGNRLLTEDWVGDATASHISNGDDPNSDWAQGYGFQFWRCRHDAYRGDGAFGQFCVVLPALDAVIAITAGSNNLGGVLNLIWTHVLPAMQPNALPEDAAAQSALTQKLATLSLRVPSGGRVSPHAARVSGRTFHFAPSDGNPSKLETARWNFSEDGGEFTMQDARGTHSVAFGFDAWQHGTTTFQSPESPSSVAARGVWAAPDTFTLTVCFDTTPFRQTLTARFSEDGVRLEQTQNVSFGPTQSPPLEGRAAASF